MLFVTLCCAHSQVNEEPYSLSSSIGKSDSFLANWFIQTIYLNEAIKNSQSLCNMFKKCNRCKIFSQIRLHTAVFLECANVCFIQQRPLSHFKKQKLQIIFAVACISGSTHSMGLNGQNLKDDALFLIKSNKKRSLLQILVVNGGQARTQYSLCTHTHRTIRHAPKILDEYMYRYTLIGQHYSITMIHWTALYTILEINHNIHAASKKQ